MSLQLNFSDNLLMTGANTSASFSGKAPSLSQCLAGELWGAAVQGAEGMAREDGPGLTLLQATLSPTATLPCKPAPHLLLFVPCPALLGLTGRGRRLWVPETAQGTRGGTGFYQPAGTGQRRPGTAVLTWKGENWVKFLPACYVFAAIMNCRFSGEMERWEWSQRRPC